MRAVFSALLVVVGAAALRAEPITIGAGSWPCQMFRLKAGDKLTSILKDSRGPLLCYTVRAMEQYDAIDSDETELSVIVAKKERALVQAGKCQEFMPGLSYTVADAAHHVLTIIREDMPTQPLYYRQPVQMAHPCD